MQQLREWLYVGNYADLVSESLRKNEHIDAVLSLVEDITIDSKEILHIDIDDGVPISISDMSRGIEFLLNQYHEKQQILVVCGAGVSRSVSYCVMIIKEVEDKSLIEAYRSIKAIYPKALPHPELWKSLCEAYEEEFIYSDLLK